MLALRYSRASMAVYAIGDVQGCSDELQGLLGQIAFDPTRDRLWFVGDLVNRGPKSLEVLRFVRSLGDSAVVVLGNHDLHLITLSDGLSKKRTDDTLDAVLAARDRPVLIQWLRTRPLMHAEGAYALVHAGLMPQWSIAKALSLAREVEAALAAPGYREFLAHMYGSQPDRWSDTLGGWDRLRVIVNAMTRMRFCSEAGVMDFHAKGGRDAAPDGFRAWFDLPQRAHSGSVVICGHWSALGLHFAPGLIALDSGCVWGGALSAVRLDDRKLFQARCGRHQAPGAG